MVTQFDKHRIDTYRQIARRIGVRAVASLFNQFDVPLEVAVRVLAGKG